MEVRNVAFFLYKLLLFGIPYSIFEMHNRLKLFP